MTTGRYAKVAKGRLQKHIEELENDPRLMDLTPELNFQRALLREITEKWQETENDKYLPFLMKLTDQVVMTADRMERIQSQKVLSESAAKLMMIRAIEVQKKLLNEWFDPEEAEGHLKNWLLTWRSEVEQR